MSTTIYNGVRYKHLNKKPVIDFFKSIQKQEKLTKERLKKTYIKELQFYIIMNITGQDIVNKETLKNAIKESLDNDSLFNVDEPMGGQIFLPLKNNMLSIPYGELRECVFVDKNNMIDYHYFNNTDKPKKITNKEWNKRREDWLSVINKNFLLTSTGLNTLFELSTKEKEECLKEALKTMNILKMKERFGEKEYIKKFEPFDKISDVNNHIMDFKEFSDEEKYHYYKNIEFNYPSNQEINQLIDNLEIENNYIYKEIIDDIDITIMDNKKLLEELKFYKKIYLNKHYKKFQELKKEKKFRLENVVRFAAEKKGNRAIISALSINPEYLNIKEKEISGETLYISNNLSLLFDLKKV